jgi:hypothetical protein
MKISLLFLMLLVGGGAGGGQISKADDNEGQNAKALVRKYLKKLH